MSQANTNKPETTTTKVPTTNKMIEKTSTTNVTNSVSASNDQQKREEGWKEVSRKSKKVSVPANVISRVIGRGGCNINQIREWSGAHIEVEKQKGQNDRMITIRGSADATRIAHLMITALAESDQELEELVPSLGLENLISMSATLSGTSATSSTTNVFTPPTPTSVSPTSDTATIDSFTPSTTPSIATTPTTTAAPITTTPRPSRADLNRSTATNKPNNLVTSITSIYKGTSSISIPTNSKAGFNNNKPVIVDHNNRGHHHSNTFSYNMVVNSKNRHASVHHQHNQSDKGNAFGNVNNKHSQGKISSAVFKPTKQLQLHVNNGQQTLSRSQHSLSNTSPSTTCSTTSTTSKEVEKSELEMLSTSNLSQKSMMFSTSSAASTGSASSSECCNPVDFVAFNNINTGPNSTSVWSKTVAGVGAPDKNVGSTLQSKHTGISSSSMFPTLPSKIEVVDESKAPGYKRHFTSPGQNNVMSSISNNSSPPFNGVASSSTLSVNTGFTSAVIAGSSHTPQSVVNSIGGPNVRSAPCTPPITSSAFNRASLANKFSSPQHNLPESQQLNLADSIGVNKPNPDYLGGSGAHCDIFSNMSSAMPSTMGLNNGMHTSNSATSGNSSSFYSDDSSIKYNNSNNQIFYGNNSTSVSSVQGNSRSFGNFGEPSSSGSFYGGSGLEVLGGNASKSSSMRANVSSDFGSSSTTPRLPGHNNTASSTMLGSGVPYNSSTNNSMHSRQYISGTAPAIANPMVRSAILNYSMNVFQPNVPKQYQEAAARLSHMSSQSSNFVTGNEFSAGSSFGSNSGPSSTNNEKLRMMQQYSMNQTRTGAGGAANSMSSISGSANTFQSNVNQQQSSNFYGLSKTSSNFSTLGDMQMNSHNSNGSFMIENAFADDEALNCLRAAIKQLPAPIGTERAQQRNLSKTPLSHQQQQPHHPLGSMLSPSSNRLDTNSLLQESSSLWGNEVNIDLLHPSASSSAANTSASDIGGSSYSFNSLGISDFSASGHDLLNDSFEQSSLDFSMWPRQSSRFDDPLSPLSSLGGGSSNIVSGGGFGASNSSSNNTVSVFYLFKYF